MAQPFVKILDNKLTLVGTVPQGNPRVVSILGKARMGKSTFFNTVVSHLRKKSEAPFKAIYGDEHCTRGIDSYFLPDHNLLLLDSQGLDYEDASHDPHLLLLLYILSDVIIFNDTRRLENGALKLMEPVCTFTNYLDIETVIKPKLYFRIFDSDVRDAQKNLEKVLGTYQDQYQSIRNSIKHLFDGDIRLLKTEPLDRPAKMMLQNNMYKELLGESLGFKEAVESILKAANSMTSKSVLLNVPEILEQINSNQEISIEKLDVVKLQAENDIHKWIQTMIPDSVYSTMEVDGTQKCFDDVVEPRKNQKKSILTAFTKRFRDVEENIRGPFYRSINSKMEAPIQKAIEDSKYKAQVMIAQELKDAHMMRIFPEVNSLNNCFSTLPKSYWDDYLGPLNRLEKVIQPIYEPLKKSVSDWIASNRAILDATIKEIYNLEAQEQASAAELASTMLVGMEPWMLDFVDSIVTLKTVTMTDDEILESARQGYLEEYLADVIELLPRRRLQFKMTPDAKIVACLDIVSGNENVKTYDLIRNTYDKFAEKVREYCTNADTASRKFLIEQKQNFLYGQLLPRAHPWTAKVIKSNPDIGFWDDEIVQTNLQRPIKNYYYSVMTTRTHEDTYLKLYSGALLQLKEKGYVDSDYGAKLLDGKLTPRGQEQTLKLCSAETKYDEMAQQLFIRRVQKDFCKMTVAGFPFPTPVNPDEIFKKSHM